MPSASCGGRTELTPPQQQEGRHLCARGHQAPRNRCLPHVASSVGAVTVSPPAPPGPAGTASQARLPEASQGLTLPAGPPANSSSSSCSRRHSGLCPSSGPGAWWGTEGAPRGCHRGPQDQGHAHKMISHSPVSRLLWLQLGEAHGLCGQSGSWACGQKREGWGVPCPPEEVGLGSKRYLGSWES